MSEQKSIIKLRTKGQQHGPIVRLVSPSEIGDMIKPFVFLDRIDMDIDGINGPNFGFHPHSGIATLTLQFEGGFEYEDSTGANGTMSGGSVEWIQAGGGIWHRGKAIGKRINGYQLWLALPPDDENAPSSSQYFEAAQFGSHGPARVILGRLGDVVSPIKAPSPINYLDVCLAAGQTWRYDPPSDHDVIWIAMHEGILQAPELVECNELAVFEPGQRAITFHTTQGAAFILGSAPQHPHPLVLGSYSVHTSPEALALGERGIRRIAEKLPR